MSEIAIRPTTAMTLLAKAVETPDFNVDAFEKLVQLQREEEDRQAQRLFAEAMASFQATAPTIKRKKKGARGIKYAPLEDIMQAIKEPLSDAGLSVGFTTAFASDGYITATCTVTHKAGHAETSEFVCPVDPEMHANASQQMGSANTYAKRYCLTNALNLVVEDEDDDGLTSGGDIYERLIKHNEKWREYETSLISIRAHCYEDRLGAAWEEWLEIPQEDQMILKVAPTKGGWMDQVTKKGLAKAADDDFDPEAGVYRTIARKHAEAQKEAE